MSFVASKIYPSTFEEISKSKDKADNDEVLTDQDKLNLSYRKKAKSAGFAINYGGNGKTIAENLGLSDKEGEEVYDDYFKAFPGSKNYFRKMENMAFKNGYINISPVTGRKYFIHNFKDFVELQKIVRADGFWDRRAEEKEKDSTTYHSYYKVITKNYFNLRSKIAKTALNAPIQGGAAEITKLAVYYIFMEIVQRGWLFKVLMSNNIHDEVLIESPKQFSKEVAKITQDSMQKAGKILGCTRVPLTAAANIVDSWKH